MRKVCSAIKTSDWFMQVNNELYAINDAYGDSLWSFDRIFYYSQMRRTVEVW